MSETPPPSGATGSARSFRQAATTVSAARSVQRRSVPVIGRVVSRSRSPAAARTGTAAAAPPLNAVVRGVASTTSVAATLKARSAAATAATEEAAAAAPRLQAENDQLRARIEALESPRELPSASISFEEPEPEPEPESKLQVVPPPAEPGAGYSKLKALQTKALPQSPEIASAHKLKHLLPGRSRGAPALNPSGSAEEVSVFSTTRMAHGMRQQTRAGKKMSSAHR